MMIATLTFTAFVATNVSALLVAPSKNSQLLSTNWSSRRPARSSISMYVDGSTKTRTTRVEENSGFMKADTTRIGSLEVPSVGIGTISWSSSSLTTLKNLELQSLVKESCNYNGALFDTAERYGSHLKTALGLGWGETESLLQNLLKKTQGLEQRYDPSRLQPVVATKFTPSPWRTTVESVVEACEQSRARLGVDQIDLYQLHMPDVIQPLRGFGLGASKDEIYWKGLCECYHRGLVKNVGVSNYGPTLLEKCHETLSREGVPLASNQIAYSLIGRHNGAQETVDRCHDLGIQVLAYYPYAMGLLTGKYSSKKLLASMDDSTVHSLTKSTKTSLEMKDLNSYARKIDPLLEVMEDIAYRHDKTISQVALNYVISKGAIPLAGARTVAQLKDNIGAMGWRLTQEELSSLESEADKLGFGFDGAGFKRTSEKFVGYGIEKWRLD